MRRQRLKTRESDSSPGSTGDTYFVGPAGFDADAVCVEFEDDAPGVGGEEEGGEDMELRNFGVSYFAFAIFLIVGTYSTVPGSLQMTAVPDFFHTFDLQ